VLKLRGRLGDLWKVIVLASHVTSRQIPAVQDINMWRLVVLALVLLQQGLMWILICLTTILVD
jgi:hypothetical protein